MPTVLDNHYRGHPLAPWLLGLLAAFKGLMGLMCIFAGYAVATRTDGIPLPSYPPEAARALVAFIGLWGWALLLLCSLSALALVRYRSTVPLMFAVLSAEQLGRKAILTAMPIAHAGTGAALSINNILAALMFIGLALSLWQRTTAPPRQTESRGART
jgi:hypothetical protein